MDSMMRAPMPKKKMPMKSSSASLPGPVMRMSEDCRQIYRDVLSECMDSGTEEKRCMAIAYSAAAEHEEGYADEAEPDMDEDDEELL